LRVAGEPGVWTRRCARVSLSTTPATTTPPTTRGRTSGWRWTRATTSDCSTASSSCPQRFTTRATGTGRAQAASARARASTSPNSRRTTAAWAYVDALGADPERIERAPPPSLTYEERALALDDLDAPAAVEAAVALAAAFGYDESFVERGAEYAREGLADGELNEFGVLLCDFATESEQRALVATRLRQHVQRRRRREDDVAGLFD